MVLNSTLKSKIAMISISLSFVVCLVVPLVVVTVGSQSSKPGTSASISDAPASAKDSASGAMNTGMGEIAEGIPQSANFPSPEKLTFTTYQIAPGDTIGELAKRFGLNQDTLLSCNSIKNSRLLQIGQVLTIPNQDGIMYTIKKKDTIESIATSFEVEDTVLKKMNNIEDSTIIPGSKLFIPGARMASVDIQEINGDLFTWPVRGYITSPYGYRTDPFTGARLFHTGIDIGVPLGTPVRAAMDGRVSVTGYDTNSGNYVIISHYSGYKTFYGHLNVIRVTEGTYVKTGDRIGDAGSTGLSTGSHLHFTVFKNGVTVNPRPLIK